MKNEVILLIIGIVLGVVFCFPFINFTDEDFYNGKVQMKLTEIKCCGYEGCGITDTYYDVNDDLCHHTFGGTKESYQFRKFVER